MWQKIAGAMVILCVGRAGYAQTLQVGSVNSSDPGNAFEMSAAEQAQAFKSDHDFVATSASLWTAYEAPNLSATSNATPYVPPTYPPDAGFQGVFDWAIYGDAGGTPGAVISSGSALPTVVSTFDGNRTLWSFTLPDVALSGDTQYWLGVHNTDGTGSFQNANLYWASGFFEFDPNVPGSQRRLSSAGSWTANPATDLPADGNGNHLSLAIYGNTITTTPEPASLAFVATGLFGLAPFVRRKRR